jgi:hypothetical protein
MFLLGLVYLIILVVIFIGQVWDDPRVVRVGGWASFILFAIIGFVIFWSTLNR